MCVVGDMTLTPVTYEDTYYESQGNNAIKVEGLNQYDSDWTLCH